MSDDGVRGYIEALTSLLRNRLAEWVRSAGLPLRGPRRAGLAMRRFKIQSVALAKLAARSCGCPRKLRSCWR